MKVTRFEVDLFVRSAFQETDVEDRIEDRGFAYYVGTQPRRYLETKSIHDMTFGNGPIVIVKHTGEVFYFSSSPRHMFGKQPGENGVVTAKNVEEFTSALDSLRREQDYSALNPTSLSER